MPISNSVMLKRRAHKGFGRSKERSAPPLTLYLLKSQNKGFMDLAFPMASHDKEKDSDSSLIMLLDFSFHEKRSYCLNDAKPLKVPSGKHIKTK